MYSLTFSRSLRLCTYLQDVCVCKTDAKNAVLCIITSTESSQALTRASNEEVIYMNMQGKMLTDLRSLGRQYLVGNVVVLRSLWINRCTLVLHGGGRREGRERERERERAVTGAPLVHVLEVAAAMSTKQGTHSHIIELTKLA